MRYCLGGAFMFCFFLHRATIVKTCTLRLKVCVHNTGVPMSTLKELTICVPLCYVHLPIFNLPRLLYHYNIRFITVEKISCNPSSPLPSPPSLPLYSGPMPNTISDFWRMIWEYKLQNIVMLTKCMEAGRVCTHTNAPVNP